MKLTVTTEQNLAGLTTAEIDRIRIKAVITIGRKAGLDEKTIARQVLGRKEEIAETAKVMRLVLLLEKMGSVCGIDQEKELLNNKAFVGIYKVLHHYYEEPEAIRFEALLRDGKTVRDAWNYFLQENGFSKDMLPSIKDFDYALFTELLDQPLDKFKDFVVTRS
jgi:hypothetical protein